jgi:hypothetical protein
MLVANLKEGQLEELLHIPEPWYIDHVDFSLEVKNIHAIFMPSCLGLTAGSAIG